jgi:hypothetical protein
MSDLWRDTYSTYGEYLRSKNIRISGDVTASRNSEKELNLYASARGQGVQPEATKTSKIREALDISDRIGRAYNAGKDSKHVME